MRFEEWVIVAVAVLAIASLLAVVLLAVQLGRTRAQVRETAQRLATTDEADGPRSPGRNGAEPDPARVPVLTDPVLSGRAGHRAAPGPEDAVIVTSDGRTLVLPSSEQVVNATMARPLVRGAVLSYGLLYAVRPKNRDRIRALVRREYRRRRKVRRRAGRRAARAVPIPPADAQAWLGSRSYTPPPREAPQ